MVNMLPWKKESSIPPIPEPEEVFTRVNHSLTRSLASRHEEGSYSLHSN